MKKTLVVLLALTMTLCFSYHVSALEIVSDDAVQAGTEVEAEAGAEAGTEAEAEAGAEAGTEAEAEAEAEAGTQLVSDQAYIEETLNITNNKELTWTYSSSADAWTMSVVTAVAFPELPDQQGVSVCVPGAYVTGIDTDGDGSADITGSGYEEPVNGNLIIDYDAEVTSTNGQVYTAATAPVILNTGAAGYGSQANRSAGTTYAKEGYVNVSCGNRGKQDSVKDEDGNILYYTGDAPSCLVDQKNAARFVKYNILLGNLPGSVDYFVSTGGSGGGAHAVMFAATSNHPDFYDYEIEAGAVGVYRTADGGYSTTVSINGTDYEISDGAWGCIAYSAITSLAEADMAMAFEYYMDADYSFNTDFQKQLAAYLAEAYMSYINDQELSVQEEQIGFDLTGDGDLDDMVALTIECDPEQYPETNGYHGTYCDLYLAEFTENVQWYLDNLDYSSGFTWFHEDGTALSNDEVTAMTVEDKTEAFIAGRYASTASGGSGGGPGGAGGPGGPDGAGGPGGSDGDSGGDSAEGEGASEGDQEGESEGDSEGNSEGIPSGVPEGSQENESADNNGVTEMVVGTPDAGTTQAAGSGTNSNNYSTFEEMLASYEADIAEVYAGDKYGKNIVELYDPLRYIGSSDCEAPVWTRIVMGEKEGDISMLNSLNMQIQWLSSGTDATIEWQYNGGHVPSEIFGNSFALWVDEMYAKYVAGALPVEKAAADLQATNGDAEEMNGTDISNWVILDENGQVSISLKDAAAYRTSGAAKAIPGFDVMDYGQEDYVFGNPERDARHWDANVLNVFQENAETLADLF